MQEGGRDDDGEMLGVSHFTQVGQGRRGCVDGSGTGVGVSREIMRLLVGHSSKDIGFLFPFSLSLLW